MLDTMTFTKVAASFCGALLVFLLGKWAAEELYHVDSHGEQSYAIDTGADEGDSEPVEEVSFADLMASADIDKGARVFRKCSACHKLEAGENVTGPYLYGVVNRGIGAAQGFGYSSALADRGGVWTPEELSAFLQKPRTYAPGTSMNFAGLDKAEDRANVIVYLDSLDN
ncbi:MAG: c-type cytochrome [Rhodobacteraceae bacterium]|nr:c-type cytochrome [Paracoccaceae bacterium]